MILSFFESYALFGDKNENIKYTNCLISTHPVLKITLACCACLCFVRVDDFREFIGILYIMVCGNLDINLHFPRINIILIRLW